MENLIYFCFFFETWMGDLDVKGQVLETSLKVLQNKARIDYRTWKMRKGVRILQMVKRGEGRAREGVGIGTQWKAWPMRVELTLRAFVNVSRIYIYIYYSIYINIYYYILYNYIYGDYIYYSVYNYIIYLYKYTIINILIY